MCGVYRYFLYRKKKEKIEPKKTKILTRHLMSKLIDD